MRKLLILAVLMCGAVYAFAGPTEFTFLGWNGGDWQNGYPYYIQPSDNPASVIAVMCDDYVHGGEPGDQWEANITDLGSDNIMMTRFNTISGPNALYALLLYDEAGWILLQTPQTPSTQWLDMNEAVWTIFDSSATCGSDCRAWIASAQEAARMGFPGTDFNKVYIVTPTDQHDSDPHSIQEFLYIGEDPSGSGANNQTTPEPGTFVLMGSGLLVALRRKVWS